MSSRQTAVGAACTARCSSRQTARQPPVQISLQRIPAGGHCPHLLTGFNTPYHTHNKPCYTIAYQTIAHTIPCNTIPHSTIQHLTISIDRLQHTTPYHYHTTPLPYHTITPYQLTDFNTLNSFPRHSKARGLQPFLSFEFATRQLIQSDTNSTPSPYSVLWQFN